MHGRAHLVAPGPSAQRLLVGVAGGRRRQGGERTGWAPLHRVDDWRRRRRRCALRRVPNLRGTSARWRRRSPEATSSASSAGYGGPSAAHPSILNVEKVQVLAVARPARYATRSAKGPRSPPSPRAGARGSSAGGAGGGSRRTRGASSNPREIEAWSPEYTCPPQGLRGISRSSWSDAAESATVHTRS